MDKRGFLNKRYGYSEKKISLAVSPRNPEENKSN